MRAPAILLRLAGFALAAAATACGNGDDTTSPPTASTKAPDATADGAGSDGAGGGDATSESDAAAPEDAGPPPALAFVRVANWSSDAPAVDFCVAPHGTKNFTGPLVANLTSAIDSAGVIEAGAAALPFPAVSAYTLLPPATYDARLVAAGAADCSVGIIADVTNLPAITVGQAITIALIGAAHPVGAQPALEMTGFLDDTLPPTTTSVRGINASPDLPLVDIGTLKSNKFTLLMGGIPFGGTAPPPVPDSGVPTADGHGYITAGALAAATIYAASAGTTTPSATAPAISTAAGAIVSFIVVGTSMPTLNEAGAPNAQLVECVDNAGTLGNLGSCALVSASP
jgi:hypothetical protein